MSDNCEVALAELYEFLDGELDEAKMRLIEQHLRDCSPCLEAFDFEAELRKMVASRCHDECPGALRSKVQQMIEAAEQDRRP